MTSADEPILYAEPGSTWWPVAWGPGFAVLAALIEALTGPVHALGWTVVGLGMAGAAAVWVSARRRLCAVRLTRRALYQGREELPVARIAEVGPEVGTSMGARVLGGNWAVPRAFEGVALRLDDGTQVLGWARDGAALRAALRRVLDS